ncbi:hypothetical protein SAMN02745725_02062 [Pseudobutyrivibrio xylanivorans DSM 14809]|uniref:Uncharacterized protein n=1 Tax=Pseudobutyrivibrio xylanivorans DSM 14809 TaxID=1123012 RepID=A0A1M6HMC3_PSEXY|nr:hypothetical protein SAMN02745725_02062 [Pseudobutyrivibrio xylanivorans DSM 14809]
MQKVDFYCKKCKKYMSISYIPIGDKEHLVLPGVIMKCHTNKCKRVVTLKNCSEERIIVRTEKNGKCYL